MSLSEDSGDESPRPSYSKSKTLAAALFIVLLALVIRHFILARPSGPLPKINAADLILDYQSNRSNASIEHDGHWLRIDGVVVGKGGGDMLETKTVYFTGKNRSVFSVQQSSDEPLIKIEVEYPDWQLLQRGDFVVFEGRVSELYEADRRSSPRRYRPEILVEYGSLISRRTPPPQVK